MPVPRFDPFAGLKDKIAKEAEKSMLSFGVHQEGLWNVCLAIALLTGGFAARHLADPFFGPDYNAIQKDFIAHNDPDGGEHVVEMFRAKDADLKLAIRLLYHDRTGSNIATAGKQ